MSIFNQALEGFRKHLRFEVQSEYGSIIASNVTYSRACVLAAECRDLELSKCDFYVVDTTTQRAVSEVFGFKYDD
jgi:hypothetical protein